MHPGVVEAEVQSEDGLIAAAAGTSSGTGSTFNMKPLLTGCQKLLSGLGLGGKKGPGMALQQIQAEPVLPEKASARDPVAGIHDKYRGRLTHTGPAAPFPLQSCMFHSRADFVHYLIPNQSDILGCPFYWGQMDRYQAEALLANQPEGSFLLRDSVQEDFVFSVSFRRYNRTLHARIEESICRSAVCDTLQKYDDINKLPIPRTLKEYLREYHYKHKIRTRNYDGIKTSNLKEKPKLE